MDPDVAAELAEDLRRVQGNTAAARALLVAVDKGVDGMGAQEARADEFPGVTYRAIDALFIAQEKWYDLTLIYGINRKRFYIGNWPDWVEMSESGYTGDPRHWHNPGWAKDWIPGGE